MGDGCSQCVAWMPMRGECHLRVAGGNRLASHCGITQHHAWHVAFKERENVIDILSRARLVDRDAFPFGRRGSQSRHCVVMTRNAPRGGFLAEGGSGIQESRDAPVQRDLCVGNAALRRRSNFLPPWTIAALGTVLLE